MCLDWSKIIGDLREEMAQLRVANTMNFNCKPIIENLQEEIKQLRVANNTMNLNYKTSMLLVIVEC